MESDKEFESEEPQECSKETIKQIEKNTFEIHTGKTGIGFFCYIPYKDIKVSAFITNSRVINKDFLNRGNGKLEIYNEKIKKTIDHKDRLKYSNDEYNITIIEVNEIDNYFELDDDIIEDILKDINSNNKYINKDIYTTQFINKKLSILYGRLDNINEDKKYNFTYNLNNKGAVIGSPIFNKKNNKIIGLNKEGEGEGDNIGIFLNEPIKEFIKANKNELLLKEYNHLYKLNIPHTLITELDLGYKDKEECIIKNLFGLSGVEFKNLKKLYLYKKSISNIDDLKKVKFEKLEILNLDGNEIQDFNQFKKFNFKELKELIVSMNNIKDLKALEKVKFDKLEKLWLYNNKISDLKVFESDNFQRLKELDLSHNEIEKINVLQNAKFTNLEVLNLGSNKITDIFIFDKVKFNGLKKLYLYKNNIADIKVFEKCEIGGGLGKLELLYLWGNKIDETKDETIINKLKSKIKDFSI